MGSSLIITVSQGTERAHAPLLQDLDNAGKPQIDNPVVRLIDKLDAEYSFVGNRATNFYVRTDRNAPKGASSPISIDNPREERWNTIVPESKDALVSASMAGDDIVGKLSAGCSLEHSLLHRLAEQPARTKGRGGSRNSSRATPAAFMTTPVPHPSRRANATANPSAADSTQHGSCRCPASEQSARSTGVRAMTSCSTASPRSVSDDYVSLRSEDAAELGLQSAQGCISIRHPMRPRQVFLH